MTQPFTGDEVRSALRNREMPLEALALDVTPTGLHYLLAHHDIPFVDPETWRLEIGGHVERPVTLDMSELARFETVQAEVTLECAGNGRALMSPRHEGQPWHLGGVSTARWSGIRLADVLRHVGMTPSATDVAFEGADEGVEEGTRAPYAWALRAGEAMRPEVMLATAMNGRPLEPQHGAPMRLVVPGWYGMASVKWLHRIDVLDAPFEGMQLAAYRLQQREDDAGVAIERIGPRALMVPPGIPDDDDRLVDDGRLTLIGRAWSGLAPIRTVELSVDGGPWFAVHLGDRGDTFAWRSWSADVQLGPEGKHELAIRATDDSGATQPDEPPWNLWGYANNAVQRVVVRRSS